MYYGASPMFSRFASAYVGREVRACFFENFEQLPDGIEAIDPCEFRNRKYDNCYVHRFRDESSGHGGSSVNVLRVQLHNHMICRFFPSFTEEEWSEREEHMRGPSTYEEHFEVRPRDVDKADIFRYKELLDTCVYKTGVKHCRIEIPLCFGWKCTPKSSVEECLDKYHIITTKHELLEAYAALWDVDLADADELEMIRGRAADLGLSEDEMNRYRADQLDAYWKAHPDELKRAKEYTAFMKMLQDALSDTN